MSCTVVDHLGTINRIVSESPCVYSITPARVTLRPGSTGTVSVAAGPACSWAAISRSPWITVTSGSTGSGNGLVTFSVAPNRPRNLGGTMIVAGQTFTVR